MKQPTTTGQETHIPNKDDPNNKSMLAAAIDERAAMLKERDLKLEMSALNREKEKLNWEINLKVMDNPKVANPKFEFENDDDVCEKRKRMVELEYEMQKMTWDAQDKQLTKMNAAFEKQIENLNKRISDIEESEKDGE